MSPLLVISVSIGLTGAQFTSGSELAVQAVVARCRDDLAAGGMLPPNWKGATVREISRRGSEPAVIVATLVVAEETVGYIALVEHGSTLSPFVFSGSRPDMSFMQCLSPSGAAGALPRAADWLGADDVIMVPTVPEGDLPRSVQPNSFAACLTSVLEYGQQKFGWPLFEYTGYTAGRTYTESLDSFLFFAPKHATKNSSQAVDGSEMSQIGEYFSTRTEILQRSGLVLAQATQPASGRQRQEATDGLGSFRALNGERRRILSEPQNPKSRRLMVKEEIRDAEHLVARNGARSAVNTFILQEAYAVDAAGCEQAVKGFLNSRGLSGQVRRKPVSEVVEAEMPCVILASGGQSAMLLRLSKGTPVWALVCLPTTVVTTTETLEERSQRIRSKVPLGPPADYKPSDQKQLSPLAQAMISGAEEYSRKTLVTRYPESTIPESLAAGAHAVTLDRLGAWEALIISDIEPDANWGSVRALRREKGGREKGREKGVGSLYGDPSAGP